MAYPLDPSPALRSRVERARSLARLARGLESLAIGALVASVIAVSARFSSPWAEPESALGPGILVGLLLACLAFRHLDWSTLRTAQALDQALALQDALPAALQARQPGRLHAALSARILQVWEHGPVLRCLLPRAWAGALLLLSVALWIGVERPSSGGWGSSRQRSPAGNAASLGKTAAGLAQQAARADLPAVLEAPLADLRQTLRALALGELESAALVESAENLRKAMSGLEEPVLRQLLESLPAASARGAESGRPPEFSQPSQAGSSARGEGRALPSGAAPGGATPVGESGPESGRGVASSAGDGTMGDSRPAAASEPTDAPNSGRPEAGTGEAAPARWWPARHDELIRRWSETQAASPDPNPAPR